MIMTTSIRGAISVAILAVLFAVTGLFGAGATTAEANTSCLPGIVKQRLAQIRAKFGPVQIVSTFRRGARIRGSGKPSFHASCRAVDFVPPRGKYTAVANWLKANHGGGVGTYSCSMHHIHIDNGPKVRFHQCIR